ncbi:MAG: DUF1572 family protein [Gelidibacter sp.]
MENNLLSGIIKQFQHYKNAGEKTMAQLSFENINHQPNEDSNSISIIVKHLVGNMLSRSTNFLTEDGEKEWRQRDQEFEASYTTKEDLLAHWEKGWNCVFDAIFPLKKEDLNKIIYIRKESFPVMEALIKQLAHYAYHIGQMAYVGKMLKGDQWVSLSIPKRKNI